MTNRTAIMSVFVIALAIRLVALAVWLPRLKPDVNLDCDRSLARHLVAGDGFVAEDDLGRVLPQLDRTPGFPVWLATLMRVGGDRLGWLLFGQCLLGALTCAATVWLAARWLAARGSLIAGLLLAIDPNSVMRCVDLRTETLFTLLLIIGAGLLAWRSGSAWAWLVAGFVWSLATLTRPIGVALWAVAILVAFNITWPAWRRAIVCGLLFVVGWLPLIGVWVARNHALTGRRFFSTVPAANLLIVRAAGVLAVQRGVPVDQIAAEFAREYRGVMFFESRAAFAKQLHACRIAALRILASAPGLAVRQYVSGWGQLLLGPGARAIENSLREPPAHPPRVWPWIYAAALAVVTALAAVGAWRLGRNGWLLVGLTLYFVLLSGGAGGNSRFRVPITPLLAILAVASMPNTRRSE